MKKMIAMLMLAAMMLSLCACGGNVEPTAAPTAPNATEAPTEPQPTPPSEPAPTEPTGKSYTVKVVDEGGNPVAGVKVQICDANNSCRAPKTTNEQGIAVYENQAEGEYKAQLNKRPTEGYEVLQPMETYYPFGDATEVTIVIKAIG